MIRLNLSVLIIILTLNANAQEWKWAYESYGKAFNGIIDIEKDNRDNIIVLLSYSQNTEDHGMYICDSIYRGTSSENGMTLIKLDPHGNCIWSLNLVGNGNLNIENIKIDLDNNILIPGYLVGGVEINGQVIGYPGVGISSGLIIKLNPDGELIWHKIFGPSIHSMSCDYISSDSNNSIYVSIFFLGDSIGIGDQIFYCRQDSIFSPSFVVKMDSDGKIIWVKPISANTSGNTSVFNISVISQGDIIISGMYFNEWISIDGYRLYNSMPFKGYYRTETFMCKLDAITGKLVWFKSFGGVMDDYFWEIKSDSKENLYISTSFYSPKFTVDKDTIYHFGERNGGLRINYALISLDTYGNLRWYKQFETMHSDGKRPYLAIDKDDKIWFNMLFAAKMDWYGYVFNPLGVLDCAYLKFDSEGILIDTFSLGGENSLMATGPIEIMNNGDLVIGNYFTGDSISIGEHSIQCDSWDYRFRKKAYDSFLARFTPKQGVGTKNLYSTIGISIHPNPTRDLLQIRLDEDLYADGRLDILTTTGTFMKSLLISKGFATTTVDVRDWPAGVYMVRYRDTEGRSSVERVVVE